MKGKMKPYRKKKQNIRVEQSEMITPDILKFIREKKPSLYVKICGGIVDPLIETPRVWVDVIRDGEGNLIDVLDKE